MSRSSWAPVYVFAFLLAIPLAGCGSSSPISVTVSTPSPQLIDGGAAASISATVMNDSKWGHLGGILPRVFVRAS
jgi:hypothetical protein